MIKKRLIPCLLMRDGVLVQSRQFKRYNAIGNVLTAIEFFNAWAVDEILLLDINATTQNRGPHLGVIREISKKCFVPLTAGGGIRSVEDAGQIFKSGADKVVVNSFALQDSEIISEIARVFGKQCVVVSIDAKQHIDGSYEVYGSSGKIPSGMTPNHWAESAEVLGAGEILLNSIDRDGTQAGYDLPLIQNITSRVNIPVIACGGVGKWQDLADGILVGGASGVSAANLLHHTEHSTQKARDFLISQGIDMRKEMSWH